MYLRFCCGHCFQSFALCCLLALVLFAQDAKADLAKALAAYKSGDFAAALTEFRASADAGDATAMFSLGFMYLRGEGVPTDPDKAVHWLEMAAERGLAPAQHSLALAFYEGRGVKRNTAIAANYFESAALQGLADAQYNLGVLYSRGDGVPQDFVRAKFWHEKAAEQGVSDSQLALGVMYANGQGVPRDYAEAAEWFGKAAAAGNKRARNTLETAFGEAAPMVAEAPERPVAALNATSPPASPSRANAPQVSPSVPPATTPKPSAPLAARSAKTDPPSSKKAMPRKGSFWRTPPAAISQAEFQELQTRAVTGDPEGQLELALRYYHGNSIKRNLVRAYVWAKRSGRKGNAAGENMANGMYWELDEQLKSVAERLLRQ